MWQRWINCGVVIALLLLAVALILPAIQQAREAERRTQSKNNLKQIGLALGNYHETYNCFPLGGTFDSGGHGYQGWMTTFFPFVDSAPLLSQIDVNQPWNSSRTAGVLSLKIPLYQIPGEPGQIGDCGFNLAHYSANAHVMSANRSARLNDLTSAAEVFLAGELRGDFDPWSSPFNWRPLISINGDSATFGRYADLGAYFVFADCRVEFIATEVAPKRLAQMSGPDLAGFEETPANIVRPQSFPCPKDVFAPVWPKTT